MGPTHFLQQSIYDIIVESSRVFLSGEWVFGIWRDFLLDFLSGMLYKEVLGIFELK
jgi:hypothetical protein